MFFFNSLSYLLFLPLVYLLFLLAPDRIRPAVLLVASYCFYGALKEPWLLAALGFVTSIAYGVGIALETPQQKTRTVLYWLGVVSILIILGYLKYFPCGQGNRGALVIIGLSYFTFQAISYLTDVYLEVNDPEKDFLHFALYMAFFPKLLQGPIERASDLLPQLKKPFTLKYESVRLGLSLLCWGLFKKVVVADRLACYVNPVYDNVHSYSGPIFVVVTYVYAFQLYFDFSGYTDIALGSARLFNLKLTQNFNRPYLAISVADFWRRWHITFSRWILDYIFKPLQFFLRNSKSAGTVTALLVTFLISGLWHGASWGFIMWGLIHGIYLASEALLGPAQRRLYKAIKLEKTLLLKVLQVCFTFHLVCFAWIFFRCNSISDAFYIIRSSVNLDYQAFASLVRQIFRDNLILGNALFPTVVTGVCSVLAISTTTLFHNPLQALDGSPRLLRYLACYSIVFMIIAFGVYDNSNFIYFKF